MGRIQSNVGLITGIPITDTIDQLIQVSAAPRDRLATRTQELQQQRVAVDTLSSRVLALKFELNKLSVSTPYEVRAAESSNSEVLSVTQSDGGAPPLGRFQYQPVQLASAQHFVSQRFESLDDLQSTGVFQFGSRGFLDKGIALDELNEGRGVGRGQIKITDLNGNSEIVDLSLARTTDEVIEVINQLSTIDVEAGTSGDAFTLRATVAGDGTLTVQEVSGGSTAADLGLLSISTSTTDAQLGTDVYALHSGTKLSQLNDGNGVRLLEGVDDLFFTVADGTADLSIDLSAATTLGDVVDAINNDTTLNSKVSAAISSDGRGLQITDLTGSDALTITSGAAGSAAEDLGLNVAVSGNTVAGNRLVAGLSDVLLTNLGGGTGLGELGTIDLTDRNGVQDSVDVSGATTLEELLDAINASSASVAATVNDARNGIVIRDTTGGSGNLIIADNVDGLETATKLGLAIDAAVDSVNGGSLNRRTTSEATLLSSLNGGEGTELGDVRITDSSGAVASFDFNAVDQEPSSIGDVIDAINQASSINVTARINDTGDGILLIDNAGGADSLSVQDVNGTLAADLNLTGASSTVEIDGRDTQVIDGRSSVAIDLANIETDSGSITLSSLNNGAGIILSDIRITDSAGKVAPLDLNSDPPIATVAELISEINTQTQRLGVGVTASINEAGNGILLTDTADGNGTLVVEDINGTAAADLNLLSNSTTTTSINASGLFPAVDASAGALQAVADNINSREAGVTASILYDGVGYRLQLLVDETGSANEIVLDAGTSGFEFTQTSSARDALLVVGGGGVPGAGVLVSSSNNQFEQVLDGAVLTANQISDAPVEIAVETSDAEIIAAVQGFVDGYNVLRDELAELTSFDSESLTTGLLFGTNAALQVDTTLSRLVTDRHNGIGSFQTLEQLGINIDDTGKLSLDTAELSAAYESDPAGVQSFFSATDRGIVDKFVTAVDRLTDAENGTLTSRSNSLTDTIELNNARIERFNESLERERTRLELEFFNLELLISNLQTSQQALGQIQAIPPLTSTRSDN